MREYDKATMHYTNYKSLIRTRMKKKICFIPNLHPRKRIPSLWNCRFRCRRHRRCRRRRCRYHSVGIRRHRRCFRRPGCRCRCSRFQRHCSRHCRRCRGSTKRRLRASQHGAWVFCRTCWVWEMISCWIRKRWSGG